MNVQWELALLLSALASATFAATRAKLHYQGRLVQLLFSATYVITTVIGAVVIATPTGFAAWSLMYPGLDAQWLEPGVQPTYWLLLFAPLILVNAALPCLVSYVRPVASRITGWCEAPVGMTAVIVAATGMCSLCAVNLVRHGYAGMSLLSPELIGDYETNIALRTEMTQSLGLLHFAFLYSGFPALVAISLSQTVRLRSRSWAALLCSLLVVTCVLYLSTFTKSNVLILGIVLFAGLAALRVVGGVAVLMAGIGAVMVLGLLESLLSGVSTVNFVWNVANIIFRVAGSFPFYVQVFPEQMGFAGATLVPTVEIMNYMFPDLTWVQGSASAAMNVVAYAEGGWLWSILWMTVAALILAVGVEMGRQQRCALSFGGFVAFCAAAYYLTQASVIGTLFHSYGLVWWFATLAGVRILDMILAALAGATLSAGERNE